MKRILRSGLIAKITDLFLIVIFIASMLTSILAFHCIRQGKPVVQGVKTEVNKITHQFR